MLVRTLALAALIATAPALVNAGEISGKTTFYWSYKSQPLAGDATGGIDIGRALGPAIGPNGEVSAIECVSSGTSAGTIGGCVETFGPGDSFKIEFRCDQPVNPLPPGAVFACNGTAVITGGTGKFANIKGTNTHQIVVTGFLSDGTSVGYTVADRHFTY